MGPIFRSIIALAIAVGAMLYFINLREETENTPTPAASAAPYYDPYAAYSPTPSAKPSNTPLTKDGTSPGSGLANLNAAPSPGSTETARVIDFTPKLETYVAEVDQNPHGTPPSLQNFATRMAQKMETALKTPEAAKALLPELEECALRSEVESPRAVCVINARRLARRFKSLGPRVSEFETKLPAALQKRVKALE